MGKKTWFLAACMLGIPVAGLAGPPFVTDDPVPVDDQHWEFNVASQDTKTSAGWTGTAPHFELNYGVVPNVQLHLLAPLDYNAPAAGGVHYDYGDTEVGVKFRFLQETDRLPQAGIFPALEIPTGNAPAGIGSSDVQAFLPLWLQKGFGDWTVYGGGGYGINPGMGNQNWGFGGVVLQRQVLKTLMLGAEIYRQTSMVENDPDETAFNIGTGIDFTDHQHLLLSAGRSIDGPTIFQSYVAYQMTFDNGDFRGSGISTLPEYFAMMDPGK